jgi:protocatechuate 3,4-dioxygenase beta subunit
MSTKIDAARRSILLSGAASAAAWCAGVRAADQREDLAPTRACDEHAQATAPQMEGPFFKPRSPQRGSLVEAKLQGTHLILSGLVLSTRCAPVPGALLDFWQCDAAGEYDNRGTRLRGHQFTDAQGRYRLVTIVPGLYPGRTRHIHVKVQAPGQPVLTTQLYFPDEPANAGDALFHADLLIRQQRQGDERIGRFDFVVRVT